MIRAPAMAVRDRGLADLLFTAPGSRSGGEQITTPATERTPHALRSGPPRERTTDHD